MKVKRFLAGILCAVLLMGVLNIGVSASAAPIYGDVDGKSGISAADALAVLQHVVNLIQLDENRQEAADVDGDDKIGSADALLILQYVVNLIELFPVDGILIPPVVGDEVVEEEDDPTELSVQLTRNPWASSEIVYKQLNPSQEVSEIRTTFQNSGTFNETIDVPSDSTMVYMSTIGEAKGGYYASWFKAQNSAGKSLDIMIPGGRDNGKEYYSMYPDRSDWDAQKNLDGSIRYHTKPVAYMCPTESYVEYKLQLVQACCKLNPGFIAIEEPECWMEGGYNEGFKEEWKKYYGTEWQNPMSSPEARFKASKLMVHLFINMFNVIGEWMEENYPEVGLVVATHSGANYVRHSIAAGINSYTAIPYVDGIIAQVWSDTINTSQPFEYGWLGYSSFGDSMQEGQVVYSLTDAKADSSNLTWDACKRLWKKSITAQLMQSSIHNFQECVWPTRGFTPADRDYKASQLNVFKVMSNVGGKLTRLYAGTPGISVAFGDSFTWQKNYSDWMKESTPERGLLGQALSLVEEGIPVTITSLDYIKSAEDLEGVKLLMISYDTSKPLSEQVNVAIADWVKKGGTVLHTGSPDGYDTIEGEWWSEKGQSPYENLLSHLNLDVTMTPAEDYVEFIDWVGAPGYGDYIQSIPCVDSDFIVTYSGSGIKPLVTLGSATLAFEAKVGEGTFLSIGLPSSYFSVQRPFMRNLVEYAVDKHTDVKYKTADVMTMQRGEYIISEALTSGDGTTLTGDFMDLFDHNLSITSSVTLEPGDSSLLFDLTRWRTQGTPRLVFTGGSVKGEITESAEQTTFTINGPAESYSSTRLLGNGLYPQKISAVANGVTYGDFVALWDNSTGSLLIKTNHTPSAPISFVIEWGSTPVEDTAPYERVESEFAVHQSNYDAEFIFSDNSTHSRTLKRCEYGNQLVYCFDVNRYPDLYVGLTVSYNYKIEVSGDNKSYQTVAEYDSEEAITTATNRTDVMVHASDYAGADGKVYIRLGNAKPSQQYGTAISELSINYRSVIE